MNDDKQLRQVLNSLQQELLLLDRKRFELKLKIKKIEGTLKAVGSIQKNLSNNINEYSSVKDKIQLYTSLFNGRRDVYPRRFEAKKGHSGYVPVCKNLFVNGLCHKPKVKCSECKNRHFEELSDDIITYHLKGHKKGEPDNKDFVIGIYPILPDDTCYFLCFDFDKDCWKKDVSILIQTCNEMDIYFALERSRSGNGAHLWIFFSEPIPCFLSRQLGTLIITKTMNKYPDIGFDSYDRMFPNQDKLPKGGFGNLIALPLQKRARKDANSVFIDENFNEYRDQWQFLSTCKRYKRSEIDDFIADNDDNIINLPLPVTEENEDKPWEKNFSVSPVINEFRKPDKPLKIIFSNQIFISKVGLSPVIQNHLIHLASFQNPEYYKKQAMRLSVWNIPRIITCAENHKKFISLPRGCFDSVVDFFSKYNIQFEVSNQLLSRRTDEFIFKGQLYTDQKKAVNELMKYENGILSATTAFGKTVVALNIISKRREKTLILVHRKQLVNQWQERIREFLTASEDSIGIIGGGKKKLSGVIDIAVMQSLYKKGKVDPLIKEYGQLIIDECHHISAPSFEAITKSFTGKFILGLTATITRKDGHHPIITMNVGPVRFKYEVKNYLAKSSYDHFLIIRNTEFQLSHNSKNEENTSYTSLCSELIEDMNRNKMIAEDAKKLYLEGRYPLILTERRDHLFLLNNLLHDLDNVILLYGGMGKKKLKVALDRLSNNQNEKRIIIATGKYIGEGFDDTRLDTLLLSMPISWKGRLVQYAGRLHRLHHDKAEIQIFDYVDCNIPMLMRMFEKRKKGYKTLGYEIKEQNTLYSTLLTYNNKDDIL